MSVLIEKFVSAGKTFAWVSDQQGIIGILVIVNDEAVGFMETDGEFSAFGGRSVIDKMVAGKSGPYASGPQVRKIFPELCGGSLAEPINLSVMETRARALVRRFDAKIAKHLDSIPLDEPRKPAATSLAEKVREEVSAARQQASRQIESVPAPVRSGRPVFDEESAAFVATKVMGHAGPVRRQPYRRPGDLAPHGFEPMTIGLTSRPRVEDIFKDTCSQDLVMNVMGEEHVEAEVPVVGGVSLTCTPKSDVSDAAMLDLVRICGHHKSVEMSTSRSVRAGGEVKVNRELKILCAIPDVQEVLGVLAENDIRSGIKIRTF